MPPIIEHAGELLSRYRVIFCDVWGVVHNGRTAYAEACAALQRFRDTGGTVVLVSNAPRTPKVVAKILVEKHVPEGCWDAIVSSGAIALAHAAEQVFVRAHHIGPDRDLDLFDGSGLQRVALDAAEVIVCTGLVRDREETGESYRGMLSAPALKRLPFICANPDLVVDVGEVQLPCAGAVAVVYEDLGGPVYWAGKPHRSAYEAALRRAEGLRGESIIKRDVLVIGDALRTDIAGAAAFGVDALFVAQGIHSRQIMADGIINEPALATLLSADAQPIIAVTATLKW